MSKLSAERAMRVGCAHGATDPPKRSLRRNLCFLTILLAGPVLAQENCGYRLSLFQSSFERGEQPPDMQLPPDSTPVKLSIDFPTDNLVVGSDTIQVHGLYTGPANTGMTVNGVAMANTETRFASYPVKLQSGSNLLTVTASTLDGSPQNVTRTVIYDPQALPDVVFGSDGLGAYAPARAAFALAWRLPAGQTVLTRVQVDYDGDGSFEIDSASVPSVLKHAYDNIGFYTATATLTFDDGDTQTPPVVRSSSTRLVMQSLAATRQTLCKVYYAMKHRLLPGASGITDALRTLDPPLRPEFETLWTDLGSNLASTAAQLGEIVDGQISDTVAELQVAVPDPAVPGEFFGFPLVLRRSGDGVWRISEM
jgi:hypothetical protein